MDMKKKNEKREDAVSCPQVPVRIRKEKKRNKYTYI